MKEKLNVELEFLEHSNRIESEYSQEALGDAIEAWVYFKNEGKPVFNHLTVMHTHYLLMRRLRLDIAGELRHCNVFIGGKKKPFISETLFREDLEGVYNKINNSNLNPRTPEESTKYCHIEFERIHPFEDGNGRVGRIIYNAHRLKLGLPIHVIHEGEEQMEYYKWF